MKYLTILTLIIIQTQVFAFNQPKDPEAKQNLNKIDSIFVLKSSGLEKGLKISLSTGYSFGTGVISIDKTKIKGTLSYQFNPNLSIGVGTGIHFNMSSIEETEYILQEEGLPPYIHYYPSYGSSNITMPVFINITTNLSAKKISPYFSLDFGGIFETHSNWVGDAGLMMGAEIGCNIRLTQKLLLSTALAYDVQHLDYNTSFISSGPIGAFEKGLHGVGISVGLIYN